MERPLDGRVAIITGGSRRRAIGAAIARRLAADGASVLVHSWSPYDAEREWGADADGPEALLGELRASGSHAIGYAADFADPGAPAAVVQADQAEWVTGQTIASDGGWSALSGP